MLLLSNFHYLLETGFIKVDYTDIKPFEYLLFVRSVDFAVL